MDSGAVQTDEDAQLVRGPVGICGTRGQEGSWVKKPGLGRGRQERQGLAVSLGRCPAQPMTPLLASPPWMN